MELDRALTGCPVMHFHSGPPMHLLSGVDISAVGSTKSSMPILILIPYVVSFLGCDDFVNGLLSCLHSRCRAHYFVPRRRMDAGHRWVRRAGDRTRRRRLNKLSCAGWVPHDRGFVLGLPHSKDERRSGDRLITAREGSPPRPCLQLCAPATLCPAAPHLVPAAMVGGT
jgi:hypothetical protein